MYYSVKQAASLDIILSMKKIVWHTSTCKERVESDKMQNEKFLLTVGFEPTALRYEV